MDKPRRSQRANKGIPPVRFSPTNHMDDETQAFLSHQPENDTAHTSLSNKIIVINSTQSYDDDDSDDEYKLTNLSHGTKTNINPSSDSARHLSNASTSHQKLDVFGSDKHHVMPMLSQNTPKATEDRLRAEIELLKIREEILYKKIMLENQSIVNTLPMRTQMAISNIRRQNGSAQATTSKPENSSKDDDQEHFHPICDSPFEKPCLSDETQYFSTASNQSDNCDSIIVTKKSSTLDVVESQSNPDPIAALMEALTRVLKSSSDQKIDKFIARQTIGKELPKFDGNPEDFPLFIEQYTTSTEMAKFTDAENMERLRRCLQGKARDAVKSLLVYSKNLPKVIDELEHRFGQPQIIIKSLITKTTSLPNAKEDKPSTIIELASALTNLTATVESLERDEYMRNPQLIQQIETKMSPLLQIMWTNHIQTKPQYTLRDITDWLHLQSRAAMLRPNATDTGFTTSSNKFEGKKYKGKVNVTHGDTQEKFTTKECIVCKKSCKSLTDCQMFQKYDVEKKWEFVTNNRLCFACLKSGHDLRTCRAKKPCGIDECTRRHNKILHKPEKSAPPRPTESEQPSSTLQASSPSSTLQTNSRNCFSTKLKILPVILKNGHIEVKCYALLDPGSTISILQTDIAQELGLDGENIPLCVTWGNGETHHESNSKLVTFDIHGCFDSAKTFNMNNVKTMDHLQLPRQTIDKTVLVARYKFLRDIPFDGYENVTPQLLIGEDHATLIAGRNVIHIGHDSPIATRTWLGWTISGNNPISNDNNQQYILSICDDNKLHELVKTYFDTDSFGVRIDNDQPRSKEDIRAIHLLEKTTTKVGDRWETGLLWKGENITLPESKIMATHRLKCLEKKLDHNSDLRKRYNDKIQHYLDSRYLVEVDERHLNPTKIWYLPHFLVVNPKKPKKIRIVFDAAAKSHGYCLNDFLVQGPDYLKPLTSILFKFRKYAIGFTGDIKEMYHQIRITPDDATSQLILWRGNDRNAPPKVYQMNVMTFGATCSPCSAIYVKDKNAATLEQEHPKAANAILENHYMDDYLDSAQTVDEAVQIIGDVIHVHKMGGFQITNFICSSKAVSDKIPVEFRQKNHDVLLGNDDANCERVLGIWWQPECDIFTFKINFDKVDNDILTGQKIPSKRDVLKLVMSIFDPLGMAANIVIKGKILLQNIWRSGIEWDDNLTDDLLCSWHRFIDTLNKLPLFSMPRCYSNFYSTAKEIHLHVFCDSSEEAFSAVGYLRFVSQNDEINVSFVLAKTRVAPLKSLSIPRLELQAAVMGSRLAKIIQQNHLEVTKTWMWTDSQTVLCWIKSDTKRFKTFVANRVGEISELTNTCDWRWLPSKENVADEATRSGDNGHETRWMSGPSFLQTSINQWPRFTTPEKTQSDDNIDEFVGVTTEKQQFHCLPDIEKFSTYLRLLRSTAFVCKFIKVCVDRKKNINANKNNNELTADLLTHDNQQIQYSKTSLTVTELNSAENYLLKRAQHEDFQDVFDNLSAGRQIICSSKLSKLNVKIINGLIRLDGRLNFYDCDVGVRNPIVLDGKNRLSKMLLMHYHCKFSHIGNATILNEIRQKYWILRAKPILRQMRRSCMVCQLRNLKPKPQLMGQIPDIRLQPMKLPFFATGLDYFGPIEIKHGRKIEKRYCALFTCMTTRAVHLEIASDLTTDACLMAIRRFISRRSLPEEIISDNGTNFIGAAKEIGRLVENLDHEKISAELSSRGIVWKRIPPRAPHMGGCWERLVRSIKEALYTALKETHPTEEVLHTVLIEAEQIVNSRPLTEVPLDHEDQEALTPNSFLIGKTSGITQLDGNDDTKRMSLRKRYEIAQHMTTIFWRRWVKEYLPTLARRSKWTKEERQFKVGDVIIIADSSLPKNTWPKGKIQAVYPGRDGVVRVVDVKTASGVSRRPVAKLCLLDVGSGSK